MMEQQSQQVPEHFDFSTPQRLSSSGFWIQSLIGLGKQIKNFIFLFIYLLIKHPSVFITGIFWLILGGLILMYFLIAYWNHVNFWFWVDENRQEFLVKKGVLNKTQIVLKFENIQQVNMKQNIIQQALDLYAIDIESAGSSEKEVNLYALDEDKALYLKKFLTEKRLGQESISGKVNQQTIPIEQAPIFKIPTRRILLVSLFTNYEQAFGLLLAFMFSVWDTIQGLTPWSSDFFDPEHWNEGVDSILELSAMILLLLLIFFLLIPLIINIFKYVIRYYGFALTKQENGNMNMHFGLLEIQNILLNREKIQMVSYKDNWILRQWKLGILGLHQISTQQEKPGRSLIHIPGIDTSQRELLTNRIYEDRFPGLSYAEKFQTIRPRIGLLLLRFSWVSLFVTTLIAIAWINQLSLVAWIGLLIFSVILYGANYLYYRNYLLLKSPGFLIKKSGIWDINQVIVSIDKVRSVQIQQNFIQKRTGTANLIFSTASGDLQISFLAYSYAVELSNSILYEMES